MRRFRIAILAAVLIGAVGSVVTLAALTGVEPGSGNTVLVLDVGDVGPGPCVCPTVFDPVACGTFPDRRFYVNSCVAACDNASNCSGVQIQF